MYKNQNYPPWSARTSSCPFWSSLLPKIASLAQCIRKHRILVLRQVKYAVGWKICLYTAFCAMLSPGSPYLREDSMYKKTFSPGFLPKNCRHKALSRNFTKFFLKKAASCPTKIHIPQLSSKIFKYLLKNSLLVSKKENPLCGHWKIMLKTSKII